MTGLWKTWLEVWCWAIGLFGVMFLVVVIPGADGPTRLFYDLVYWPLDGASGWGEATRLTASITGALMIGWAITLHTLMQAAIRANDPGLWRGMTLGVLTWFVVDSAASVASGVPVNAVSNAGLVAGFLIPVLASGVLRGRPSALSPA